MGIRSNALCELEPEVLHELAQRDVVLDVPPKNKAFTIEETRIVYSVRVVLPLAPMLY